MTFANGMFFVNFDLAFVMPNLVSCNLSIPYDAKLMLHLITPIGFAISIKIAQLTATFIGKMGKNPSTKLRLHAQTNQAGTIMMNLGMLLYPSLTTRVFSAFSGTVGH